MFRCSTILIFFATLFLTLASHAQEIFEDENWFYMGGQYSGAPFVTYQLKTFTMNDVALAKERLKTIRSSGFGGEWDGVYSRFVGIGDNQMAWNSRSGYFEFYYYHEMKMLDFGNIVETNDGVWFGSARKGGAGRFLVKVRFGERRHLVLLQDLPKFCRLAAGIEPWGGDHWIADWQNDADQEKPVSGLPIVAPRFAEFVRSPIKAKIVSIGGKFPARAYDGKISMDRFRIRVRIDAGSNRGVKRGMNFFVDQLGEWIAIESVSRTRSVGYLERSIEDNKIECWDQELGSGMPIPCKKPRIGLPVRTKPSAYRF